MYNKVPANMNFVEREKNIEKFWEDEIPRDEGLHGSEKGWMGYPRSSG